MRLVRFFAPSCICKTYGKSMYTKAHRQYNSISKIFHIPVFQSTENQAIFSTPQRHSRHNKRKQIRQVVNPSSLMFTKKTLKIIYINVSQLKADSV